MAKSKNIDMSISGTPAPMESPEPKHRRVQSNGERKKRRTKYYCQEGNNYYYVDEKGNRRGISQAQFQAAIQGKTQYWYFDHQGIRYFATSDDRYFYIDSTGSKIYIDKSDWQRIQKVQNKKLSSPGKQQKDYQDIADAFQSKASSVAPQRPRSQYVTQFNKDFSQKKQMVKAQPVIHEQAIMASKIPIDFETTHAKEYRKFEVSPPPKREAQKANVSNAKMVANSKYKNDYPNWGMTVAEDPYRQNKPTVYPGQMELDARTSYGANYAPNPEARPAKSLKAKEMESPIKGIGDPEYQTSAQTDYRKPQYQMQQESKFTPERILALNSGPDHYRTSFDADYSRHSENGKSKGDMIYPVGNPNSIIPCGSQRPTSAHYLSRYEKDYHKRSGSIDVDQPFHHDNQIYLSKIAANDGTSNWNDFKKHVVEAPELAKAYHAPQRNVKFNGRTKYADEFPDWGPSGASPARPIKVNHWVPMPLDDRTQYSTQFHSKQMPTPAQIVKHSNGDIIQHAQKAEMVSEKKAKYSQHNVGAPERAKGDRGSFNIFSGPGQYATETGKQYTAKLPDTPASRIRAPTYKIQDEDQRANQTFIAYEVSESNYTGRSRPSTAGSRRSSVGALGSGRFSDKWATPRGTSDVKKRPMVVGDHSQKRVRTAESLNSRVSSLDSHATELEQNKSVIEGYFSRQNSKQNTKQNTSFSHDRLITTSQKTPKSKKSKSSQSVHKHRTHRVAKALEDKDQLNDELKKLVRETISRGGYSSKNKFRNTVRNSVRHKKQAKNREKSVDSQYTSEYRGSYASSRDGRRSSSHHV